MSIDIDHTSIGLPVRAPELESGVRFSYSDFADARRSWGAPLEEPLEQYDSLAAVEATEYPDTNHGYTSSQEILESRRKMRDHKHRIRVGGVPNTAKRSAPPPHNTELRAEVAEEPVVEESFIVEWERRCYPMPEMPSGRFIDKRNEVLDCAGEFFTWRGLDQETGEDRFTLRADLGDDSVFYDFGGVLAFHEYYKQENAKKLYGPTKNEHSELFDYAPRDNSRPSLDSLDELFESKPVRPAKSPTEEELQAIFPEEKNVAEDWEDICLSPIEAAKPSRFRFIRVRRAQQYEAEINRRNTILHYVKQRFNAFNLDGQGNYVFTQKNGNQKVYDFSDILDEFEHESELEKRRVILEQQPYTDGTKSPLRNKIHSFSPKRAIIKTLVKHQTRSLPKPDRIKTPEQTERTRRRRKVAITVGGAAVTVFGFYAASKGWIAIPGSGGKQHIADSLTDFVPRRPQSVPEVPVPGGSRAGQDQFIIDGLKQGGDLVTKTSAASDFAEIRVNAGDTFSGDVATQALEHFGYQPSAQSVDRLTGITNYFYDRDMGSINEGETIRISRLAARMAINGG